MNICHVIESACDVAGCSVDEYNRRTKKRKPSLAREFVCGYLHVNGHSNDYIASVIGRDKSLVSHNLLRFHLDMKKDTFNFMYHLFVERLELRTKKKR